MTDEISGRRKQVFERHSGSFVERFMAVAMLQLARGSHYSSNLIRSKISLSWTGKK